MKDHSEPRSPWRWAPAATALFFGAWLAHPAQAVGFCGDGYCAVASEDEWSCPEDCGSEDPPYCGDGTCNGSESCASCVADCGQCPPPTNVVQAYTCPDTDTRFAGECPGMCGPRCMGVWAGNGVTIKKWTCECLKYGLSAPTCLASGVGCVGSQALEEWSIMNQPDLGPQGMDTCDLSGAPTPAQYCSYYGNSETKPVKPGLEPCRAERLLEAKYIAADYHPKWADFYNRWRYIDSKQAALFTLSEPGRFKMGISCVATGFGVIRVGPDSLLCRGLGKCSAGQMGSITESDINYLASSPGCTPIYGDTGTGGGCAEIPFFHKCGKHGFGWYDATRVPAGTYVAFAGSGSGFFGLIDGHGTMDTYVYEGGGGVHYALGSTGCPQDQPPDPCGGDPCCGDPCCGDPCCGDPCCGFVCQYE